MIIKLPIETIHNRIHVVRGHKVMFDYDLAELYHVATKRLNEQVRRNIHRFPPDFMFRLTAAETQTIRSQIATGSKRNKRFTPLAFTEHGVAMLASVLNSERAIRRQNAKLKNHDSKIEKVFEAIYELMEPPQSPRKPIGFRH